MEPMKPPSKEFLDELVERAKRFGWSGDYDEVTDFIDSIHIQYGLELPDLTPYETEDE